MASLDLDNANVFEVEMTVEQVRALEVETTEDLDVALDNAQGHVFTGNDSAAWVVIKIVK